MSKNDDRILVLKKQIEEKRKDLEERKFKFTPETTCVLELDGITYNLNVCNENTLHMLLVKLNMYCMSAADLFVDVPEFNGFAADTWMTDVRNKLNAINIKKEEANLKKMESKLDKLLSEDKKTELELDEIASLLG